MPTPIVQSELERRLQAMQTGFAVPPEAQPAVQAVAETNAEDVAKQQAEETEYANHFANLLAQNEAYRQQQSAAWEKREKEAKARKSIAAVSDALSSLGNLVGTAYGAAPQQQTYQMPFINKETEEERALARATADRIRATEQNLLGQEATYGMSNPFALENLRHKHTMEQIGARSAATNEAIGLRGEENRKTEDVKQGNRVSLKEMDLKYKGNRDKMLDYFKQQGINLSREKLDEAIRHNQTMEVIYEKKGGGGNVGGYKVVITRDQFGREISRERIPTTNNLNVNWEDDNSGPRVVEWE